MIININRIIEKYKKYCKINRNINSKIKLISNKMKEIKKFEGLYDMGLSVSNLKFKITILKQLLEHRQKILKEELLKIYSDSYYIYEITKKLFFNINQVIKENKMIIPNIPKIIFSTEKNTIDIEKFKDWLHSMFNIIQAVKTKIMMMNERRDMFATMIRDELPSIELDETINLQKQDLKNEYDKVKQKIDNIITFHTYIVENIFQYDIYQWKDEK
jgi:hypothetical protein